MKSSRPPLSLVKGSSYHQKPHSVQRSAREQSSSSSSSSSNPSSLWSRALPPGANPAYDAALDYLSEQQSQPLTLLKKMRSVPNPSPALLRRINKTEIEAYINDPAVRHSFRESNGRGMMDQPVMRYLAEGKWKRGGGLDLVMGRIYQNKVVPDVIPDLGPTNPLTLTVESELIEPGIDLKPSKLNSAPSITFQPFDHPSQPSLKDPYPVGLYTLLMIDPDTPSPDTQSYSQRLHYLKTDIPLSILSGEINLLSDIGQTIVPWEPPAPERGSGRHRYVFILLRQTSTTPTTSSSPMRENFDYRNYLVQKGYSNISVVGINLFRSIWSEDQAEFVNSIFREYRGIPMGAPVYGDPPKEVKYGYPLSSTQRRMAETRQQAWEKVVRKMSKDLVKEEDGIPA